ncbi:MAG: 37S ribosomal protein S16, mitochondrial, partial [Candelina submexicana]
TYDPIPKVPSGGDGKPYKDIQLDSARAKYWLGVGAQPSDPAWRLLSMWRRGQMMEHLWDRSLLADVQVIAADRIAGA